jgi:hypothetical protein
MSKPSRKNKAPQPPTKVSRADKFKLIGIPLLWLCGMALLYHFACVTHQTSQINKTVNGWKSKYHIDDEQARRIIEIELGFHGSGSPFSLGARPAKDDKYRHHEEISQLMSDEDGARFMEAMEKDKGDH